MHIYNKPSQFLAEFTVDIDDTSMHLYVEMLTKLIKSGNTVMCLVYFSSLNTWLKCITN